MAIKSMHSNEHRTYFITFTCTRWLPLIEITDCYNTVYSWFAQLKEKYDAEVVAYVIMPNHLHLILHFNHESFNLNAVISNGKRFIAYEIIRRLKQSGNESTLSILKSKITARERRKGQLHKVFKDSFDAKPIIKTAFLMQKINYIHNNPVRGKWMLAADFIAYPHSSASFYETGHNRHITLLHFASRRWFH